MSRNRFSIGLLAFCAASAIAQTSAPLSAPTAPTAQLAKPEARITDGVIQTDHSTYEAMQARIKALNDSGNRPVRDYFLSKAQCWLDVSFHEYTRNDRSAFTQAALSESEKLVQAMERKQSPINKDTAWVNNAARLRPDLWAQTESLKTRQGASCAAQQTASAEVELVHAGNEHNQQQWRHAKPYVQMAEDLIAQGKTLAERCEAAAAKPAPVAPPPPVATAAPVVVAAPAPAPKPVPAPVPVVQTETLLANAVFKFDRHAQADLLPASSADINALVRKIKDGAWNVKSIELVAHADRLNGTRDSSYNKRLSERRANTVRDMLVAQGVDAKLINAAARGDDVQLEKCDGKFKNKSALQDCLGPNRRVEIRVQALR